MEKTMTENTTNKPTHYAYNVEKKGSGDDAKSYWTKIGAMFPHNDGNGFTFRYSALPLSGEIVFRTPEEKHDAASETSEAA